MSFFDGFKKSLYTGITMLVLSMPACKNTEQQVSFDRFKEPQSCTHKKKLYDWDKDGTIDEETLVISCGERFDSVLTIFKPGGKLKYETHQFFSKNMNDLKHEITIWYDNNGKGRRLDESRSYMGELLDFTSKYVGRNK